jgi:hypothetical protein
VHGTDPEKQLSEVVLRLQLEHRAWPLTEDRAGVCRVNASPAAL